ncbi:MAG: hypothetical protein HQK83_00040 [Fibrobacteria bacterium]|nr:hypothetical protein [Fibrobacteria bacterium]
MHTNSRIYQGLSFLFVLLFLCLYPGIGQEEVVAPVEDVPVEETQQTYNEENISYQKDRLFVAVNNFLVDGYDSKVANVLSDRFRTELFSTNLFNVIEREQMNMILTEQEFQNSDCVSDACLVQAGQLMGVTHIFTGTVTRISKTTAINIRMINVETGKIDFTTSTDCRACEAHDLLKKPMRKLAAKVSRFFKPEDTKYKPWWKKPWAYVGAGVVAAGVVTTVILLQPDDGGGKEQTAAIQIK